MRDVFVGMFKGLTRISAFVSKDVVEVIRRPGTLFALVLGPFLIMALFGVGYSGQRRPLDTVISVPAASNLPREAEFYQQFVGAAVRIVGITEDAEGARQQLQQQRIDLLVVVPPDVGQQFLAGQQSEILIEYNQIDPIRDNYARFLAYRQVQELNRAIIEVAATQGQSFSVQAVGTNAFSQLPAEVIASPTRAELKNWAQTTPEVVTFFAPAVLALIVQHMGVTLTALSMVRERLSGAIDIFRVAPVRTVEILLGKYVAYTFFNLSIATLVTFLLVLGLGVPLLGDPGWFALSVALLTFASVGMGLLISVVANSERQAVQFAMLVLLSSVFFSGFVLPLDEFVPAVQALAYLLPVTAGIRLFQDFMLRGGTYDPTLILPGGTFYVPQFQMLAGLGVLLFLVTAVRLRRALSHA
jgi:ABC-2 type transport system permease protein